MESYEFVDLDGIYDYYESEEGNVMRKERDFSYYDELEEWYYYD